MKQRNSEREKVVEHALQKKFIKKAKKGKEKWKKNQEIDENSKNQSDSIKKSTSNKNSRKKVDMKKGSVIVMKHLVTMEGIIDTTNTQVKEISKKLIMHMNEK